MRDAIPIACGLAAAIAYGTLFAAGVEHFAAALRHEVVFYPVMVAGTALGAGVWFLVWNVVDRRLNPYR